MSNLKIDLARQAIKLPEFQEFMICEMKITDEQLTELKGCRECWENFRTRGSIKKINARLEVLLSEKKIKKRKVIKTMRFDDPEKAIEYIRTLGILMDREKICVSHPE